MVPPLLSVHVHGTSLYSREPAVGATSGPGRGCERGDGTSALAELTLGGKRQREGHRSLSWGWRVVCVRVRVCVCVCQGKGMGTLGMDQVFSRVLKAANELVGGKAEGSSRKRSSRCKGSRGIGRFGVSKEQRRGQWGWRGAFLLHLPGLLWSHHSEVGASWTHLCLLVLLLELPSLLRLQGLAVGPSLRIPRWSFLLWLLQP